MQEAAVLLAGACKAGGKLQSVLDLLARHGHQTGHVAKGADHLAGLEAPGTCRDIGTDAAAVHDCDIAVQLFDLIEVGVDAVGHKVAEVGLCRADAALAGLCIADIELAVAHCDLLAQHIVHIGDPLFGNGIHHRVRALIGGDERGGNGAYSTLWVDGHAADILKVGAGLGQ